MLNVCESFALANNIRFSTHVDPKKSKSKSMLVTGHKQKCTEVLPLVLCGENLPWVDRCDHLGHILTSSGSMEDDCLQKRADFIDSAVKVKESFSFAHPKEVLNAVQKYCTSFHGSNLFDLRGSTAQMIYASWQTNVKWTWDLGHLVLVLLRRK